ncbi:MAG: D-alanyl-D-alanine carboxypeptidase [Rhodospirillaceae bacterium]|jgi:serine-type D-Ala-D-Ala carboxypeptidase (penicillin-binding protein 5/6)|nr:D-alanyl-D-alanine carboxypeptidase [Rhodospirillaceae bacterium]MBT3886263.1 D-alanyl-D-alanine carboxypeptidase [Rhodospirillaceae bacterium]MBT4114823.1 D-alanyl-D-alanine carboxypeptidase [Rhodospirillaceae bacterium]MBT4673184.1 D-alanyl-D-alanine carboxypeptidase [Rhodospirillaceae bacterium]MBT4720058.1 D-alanyl-D-alanine carboxypeptidase [Rhodospirillaceae bacterium]
MRNHKRNLFAVFGLVASLALAAPGMAIELSASQAILIDFQTGEVLFEKDADLAMTPSSMSKIMTVYKIFERLKDGRLQLTDSFAVSEKAWRKKGSKMFVAVNSRVKVEDLIRGIVVQSGNDASIVVAEGLAGSEDAFAAELNETARELGMGNSNFVNASGWPDADHRTTARDLAKLALATIRNFPDYYHYYSEQSFSYNGIKQGNRNPLIYRDVGADGLKTGHTEAGGFGLTASAIRGGRRLVAVLNGMPTKKARGRDAERLMDWGFREFNNYTLFEKGAKVSTAPVWMGAAGSVALVLPDSLTLSLPVKARRKMVVKVAMNSPVPAPVKKGDQLARLKIEMPGRAPMEFPLLAGEDVERLGAISRLAAALRFILFGEAG